MTNQKDMHFLRSESATNYIFTTIVVIEMFHLANFFCTFAPQTALTNFL